MTQKKGPLFFESKACDGAVFFKSWQIESEKLLKNACILLNSGYNEFINRNVSTIGRTFYYEAK